MKRSLTNEEITRLLRLHTRLLRIQWWINIIVFLDMLRRHYFK